MTERHMTISEMCELFDVTPRTLQYYEAKELLFPLRVGQKRLFTRRDRARLTLILRAKRYGFALEDIRQWLDLYDPADQGQRQLRAGRDMARERLAELVKEHEALTETIAELKAELELADKKLAATDQILRVGCRL